MKKIFLILGLFLSCAFLNAQINVPDYAKYRPAHLQVEKSEQEISQDLFSASMALRGTTGYAAKAYPEPKAYVSFSLSAPLTTTTISASLTDLAGGAYYDGVLYCYKTQNSAEGTFLKVNPTTGAIIQTLSGAASISPTGMSYNYANNTMYGYGAGKIYTINLTSGAITQVANCSVTDSFFGFAINLAGTAYGVAKVSGSVNLYTINLTSGACTLVGATGQTDINYLQSMGFDYETGILYWAHSGNYDDWFRTINTTTGQATFISNSNEYSAFHVPYNIGSTNVTITTAASPSGSGTVTGGGTYAVGAPVTLTAIANSGFTFQNWTPGGSTANPLTFNATENATYTANFQSTGSGDCDPATNLAVNFDPNCTKATLTWNEPAKKRGVMLWDNTAGMEGNGYHSERWMGAANARLQLADDFIVPAGESWSIEEVFFYGFPSNGPPAHPLPENIGIQIFQDNGSDRPSSTIVYENNNLTPVGGIVSGEMTIMLSTPILITTPGKYWFSIYGAYDGTQNTGKQFYAVVSKTVKEATMCRYDPNCLYGNPCTFTNWAPSIPEGTPAQLFSSLGFYLKGTIGGPPATDYSFNVYRDEVQIAGPIVALSYDDVSFTQGASHTWSVKVVCEPSGLSDPVSVTTTACGEAGDCQGPKNLAGSFVNGCNVKLTWVKPAKGAIVSNSNSDNYGEVRMKTETQNLSVAPYKVVPCGTPAPKGMVNVTLEAGDVWGDGSGYQMLIGPTSLWGTTIPATGILGKCATPPSYAPFTYKIPANADAVCTTSNIVYNNSVTIQVEVGTYAYCVANPSYDSDPNYSNFWIASGSNGRKASYEFKEGYSYHFLARLAGVNDEIVITETPYVPPTSYNIYRNDTLLISNHGSETYTDTDAYPLIAHKYSVKAICEAGGESSPATFTFPVPCTLPSCDPATITDVSPEGEGGLKITWTAPIGKYTLYRDGEEIVKDLEVLTYEDKPLAAGQYCYTLKVNCPNGLISPLSNEKCGEVLVGITENANTKFSIVPNPAHSTIAISAAYNFNKIEIVSFLGQTIHTQSNVGNSTTLDISNYSNGVYFIRITSEEGTSVKKFVKQ